MMAGLNPQLLPSYSDKRKVIRVECCFSEEILVLWLQNLSLVSGTICRTYIRATERPKKICGAILKKLMIARG